MLADIMKHVLPDRAFEEFYPQLHNVVRKILPYTTDFSTLFTMVRTVVVGLNLLLLWIVLLYQMLIVVFALQEKFMTFVDLFQRESVKVDVCKIILEHYVRHQQEPVNDSVVINALMFFCKVLHDSVRCVFVTCCHPPVVHLFLSVLCSN